MSLPEVYNALVTGLKETTPLEYIGVFAGIISVLFQRKANILVYPIGLVNTIIYVYISIKGSLFGEASVNFYYTVMSIYGWILWARKDEKKELLLNITYSTKKEWVFQLSFFAAFYIAIYAALVFLKQAFYSNTIPWADAFASASAYTGMWLLAKKKIESWYWWIVTNTASIPLYFVKGYVFTSFQYVVLLALAFAGLVSWMKKDKSKKAAAFTHE
ncbi:MAG TPA: nicotinamide riboside transporter PnuC [Chitinophagaceae bacterium]|nr:nicotinamide riboside transporter PnuC [Chitinophagaceae bacterium]